jgi:hypothetical protein
MRPVCFPYCDGAVHPAGVQIGNGLPSAKLGMVEVISRKAAMARIRATFFIGLLLGKMDSTVLLCRPIADFERRTSFVFLFGKRNL